MTIDVKETIHASTDFMSLYNDPRYLSENSRKYKNFGKLVYNVKS